MNGQKGNRFIAFISYYKPYKRLLFANLAASVSAAFISLALPLCVRHITGDILVPGATDVLPAILGAGAFMASLIIAHTALSLFNDWMGHVMGAKIERDLRNELFAHYQALSLDFFDTHGTGDLMSRLTHDLFGIGEVSHHVPILALSYGIQLVGSVVILLKIDSRLAMLMFTVLLVIILYASASYGKLQKSYRVNRERMADINTTAEENLSGMYEVKMFVSEKAEIGKFKQENDRFYHSRSDIYKHEALLFSIVEYFLTPLMTLAIIVAGGVWIADGTLSLSALLVFIMYSAYLTAPIPRLVSVIPFYQSGFTGFARYDEIMSIKPSVTDHPGAEDFAIQKGAITFEKVSFRYREEREYVLNDVSFHIEPGETIAVTGRSGIGKTTICALIPRLYDVNDGKVLIDGVDIRNMTLQSLRSQIGIVSQEVFLFAGTIMDNILYGNPNAVKSDAIAAAGQANAHDFIMALPDGYETKIGRRGIGLSAGQKQRISIARIFVKNPPILILDEATSALDRESETAVMEALNALKHGRTALIITHKTVTMLSADHIMMLTDEGGIETGNYAELTASDTAFARLYAGHNG